MPTVISSRPRNDAPLQNVPDLIIQDPGLIFTLRLHGYRVDKLPNSPLAQVFPPKRKVPSWAVKYFKQSHHRFPDDVA